MADHLDAMIAALRDGDEPAARQVDVTRRRVMASLEQRATGRRRRVLVIVAALTVGTGTLSWAATTGRLAPVLHTLGLRTPPPTSLGPDHRADRIIRPHAGHLVQHSPVPVPVPAPVLSAQPSMPEDPQPAPPPASTRRRPRPAAPASDGSEAQFRRANDLHFRGDDAAAALAAWEAYLSAYPHGAFAVEARYNRALALVRLRRWEEARLALAPFVAGLVAPHGYRQGEAKALVEAIDRHLRASAPATIGGKP